MTHKHDNDVLDRPLSTDIYEIFSRHGIESHPLSPLRAEHIEKLLVNKKVMSLPISVLYMKSWTQLVNRRHQENPAPQPKDRSIIEPAESLLVRPLSPAMLIEWDSFVYLDDLSSDPINVGCLLIERRPEDTPRSCEHVEPLQGSVHRYLQAHLLYQASRLMSRSMHLSLQSFSIVPLDAEGRLVPMAVKSPWNVCIHLLNMNAKDYVNWESLHWIRLFLALNALDAANRGYAAFYEESGEAASTLQC